MRWRSGSERDQHRGVGTAFLCDTKVGPIKLVDHMEITEWTPGVGDGCSPVGVVTGTGRFTLTPIDLGRRTRFAWEESLVFPWWLGGRLGALIGGRAGAAPDLEAQPAHPQAPRPSPAGQPHQAARSAPARQR